MKPWHPLKRIDLAQKPEKIIREVSDDFNLGRFRKYELIRKGVIEINFKVSTSKGEYIVKIFSNKILPRVKDILYAQQKFYERGIPFPRIYYSKGNKPYFITLSKSGKEYYGCVIKFFDGKDFTHNAPTTEELKRIAKYTALINSTKLDIKPIYDECFPINIAKEYRKRKNTVEPEVRPCIEEIIQEFDKVDLKKLRWGTIHGDLSWEHFLRGKNDSFCVLDLGALNINPIVLDLAYAMSYFCINPRKPFNSNFIENYSVMLDEYLKHVKLSRYEIENLPIFIKVSLAHDYVIGRYYLNFLKKYRKVWFTPKKFYRILRYLD